MRLAVRVCRDGRAVRPRRKPHYSEAEPSEGVRLAVHICRDERAVCKRPRLISEKLKLSFFLR